MDWFILAAIPPFFWALTNFIDQYLTRTYFMGKPFIHMCFSVIAYILILAVIMLLHPSVLNIELLPALGLFALGPLFYTGLIPYVFAIQQEDASNALPLYQSVPFFTLIIGWMLFGEALTVSDILSGAIIIIGGMGMLWDFRNKLFSVRVFQFMILSSVIVSLYLVLLRHVSLDTHWITVTFWVMAGRFCTGLAYLAFKQEARAHIKGVLTSSRFSALGWDLLQHIGAFIATAFMVMAMAAAANTTSVALVNGLQPFFLLIFGVILGRVWPELFHKHLTDRYLVYRLGFLCLIFAGLFMLLKF